MLTAGFFYEVVWFPNQTGEDCFTYSEFVLTSESLVWQILKLGQISCFGMVNPEMNPWDKSQIIDQGHGCMCLPKCSYNLLNRSWPEVIYGALVYNVK